eukprot:4457083-Pleurochrysis_carterae.AAC.1
MCILPFGCRAYAVKPRQAYSKTRMEPRAWSGINLGRSIRSPGAYNVWIPTINRIVVTSDVYFDERSFPWSPSNPSHAEMAQRAEDDGSQPPGVAAPSSVSTDAAFASPRRLQMPKHGAPNASRRVLILFSGPFSRPDGMSSFLTQNGLTADCIDNCAIDGRGRAHNILVNSVYERLLQRCADGYYMAVFASPP